HGRGDQVLQGADAALEVDLRAGSRGQGTLPLLPERVRGDEDLPRPRGRGDAVPDRHLAPEGLSSTGRAASRFAHQAGRGRPPVEASAGRARSTYVADPTEEKSAPPATEPGAKKGKKGKKGRGGEDAPRPEGAEPRVVAPVPPKHHAQPVVGA